MPAKQIYNKDDTDKTGSYYIGRSERTDEDRKSSELCLEIAKNSISTGNFGKAKNMLLKSIRIYPNDAAENLLDKLDGLKNCYSRTSYQGSGATYRNKDEAEKCIKIAEEDFVSSRLAKAERFLLKAERMYPTVRAKDLLRQIADVRAKGVKDTEERMPNEYNKASTRQQADVRKGQNSKTDTYARNIEQGPTQQDIEAIQRIETANSDFEILGVQRGCSHVEARKSFKRISKLVHPDRNRAPGASEAFMKLQRAYNRLQAQINQ